MFITYYSVKYDNEASGPFVVDGANVTWTGGVGFITALFDDGATGRLIVALVSGVKPTDGLVLTQGSVTADADGDAELVAFPGYMIEDTVIPSSGSMSWKGTSPALGATHSFYFDGQTADVVAGEILTFSGGQQCEVITVESDAGASGELSVRWMSFIDQDMPDDDDTFTGDIAGDGVLNGAIHPRVYTPLEMHRLLSYLNYYGDVYGDDDLSRVDPIPSGKDTIEIVNLLSTMTITDELAQHMYAGSINQSNGDTLYAGVNIQVTSQTSDTRPVIVQDDAIVTDYWKNAFMPHSIDGSVRILRKIRDDGVDIDGKRIRAALLEYKDSYFFAGTTFGTGTTALALFASPDGNNTTDAGTVAGAPYNTIIKTEGYQTQDYNNSNGATPFGLTFDYGSANSLQTYERFKYNQRRGSAEVIFGRNHQLFIGMNLNFAYNNEAGSGFSENGIVGWGTEITYSTESGGPFTVGEVVDFVGSGAIGRLIWLDDDGLTGTMMFAMEGSTVPLATDTLLGKDSAATADVDIVVTNSNYGTALLIALDDGGTTGNLYMQLLTGLIPVDTQTIFGATGSVDVNGTISTRTINNQFSGVFTGTNHQTNFGVGIDNSDAIVGDKFRNLLDVVQEPPDNQQGIVAGLEINDAVTVYPWDGVTYDTNGDAQPTYNEAVLAVVLTSGVSTVVDVGTGNIPKNTPQAGWLRIERDSDNNMALVEYSSHDGDDEYTLVGTSPITASIGNNVMRAFIDEIASVAGQLSYTAVKDSGTNNKVTIVVQNGSLINGPIKPYPTTATFSAGGFSVTASRISDA